MTKAALLAAGAYLLLGACATPRVLKAPIGAPTMARPSQANPIPAYAAPDSSPHAAIHDDTPQYSAAPPP
jgi:hypothetical protein